MPTVLAGLCWTSGDFLCINRINLMWTCYMQSYRTSKGIGKYSWLVRPNSTLSLAINQLCTWMAIKFAYIDWYITSIHYSNRKQVQPHLLFIAHFCKCSININCVGGDNFSPLLYIVVLYMPDRPKSRTSIQLPSMKNNARPKLSESAVPILTPFIIRVT